VEPAIQVTQKFWLNISEVSGLGWRLHPRTGLPDLLAVSDAEDTLLTAAFDGGGIQGAYNKVSNLPHGLRSERRAEWEAVAGDAAGRVLIVHETGSGLVVLAPDLSFERRVTLKHDWSSSTHYGLESLLLLRHGHLLSAKQENPVVLLEFAPKGERARGFGPDQLLGDHESFDLSNTDRELHQVKVWNLAGATEDPASINDLALDQNRNVMAISSKSRRVVRLEHAGPADDHVGMHAYWDFGIEDLGETEDVHAGAEGLLIHPQLGSFISIDTQKRDIPNLFRVTAPWGQG
jgi:hypothetical protein